MTKKQARSLERMLSETTADSGGGLTCPSCGCQNFSTYGTFPGQAVTVRYKKCRNPNCNHKIITSTETTERYVRDVETHDKDDEPSSVIKFGT